MPKAAKAHRKASSLHPPKPLKPPKPPTSVNCRRQLPPRQREVRQASGLCGCLYSRQLELSRPSLGPRLRRSS